MTELDEFLLFVKFSLGKRFLLIQTIYPGVRKLYKAFLKLINVCHKNNLMSTNNSFHFSSNVFVFQATFIAISRAPYGNMNNRF
jgi:hypothetical protein